MIFRNLGNLLNYLANSGTLTRVLFYFQAALTLYAMIIFGTYIDYLNHIGARHSASDNISLFLITGFTAVDLIAVIIVLCMRGSIKVFDGQSSSRISLRFRIVSTLMVIIVPLFLDIIAILTRHTLFKFYQ